MAEHLAPRRRGRPPGSKNVAGTAKDGKGMGRKDAVLNREKLIAAASQIMRETGGDVPFEAIAVHAGVARGTLYRNFNDRHELYEVVLDHDLEVMIAKVAALPDDDILGFIRVLAEMMMVYDKFLAVLPVMSDYPADNLSQAKISATLALPLARAKRRGLLREDLTTDDVQLASRMLAANWRLDMKSSFQESFDARFNLMLAGIGGPKPTQDPAKC
jgi:AcrR family transcriptional regulator